MEYKVKCNGDTYGIDADDGKVVVYSTTGVPRALTREEQFLLTSHLAHAYLKHRAETEWNFVWIYNRICFDLLEDVVYYNNSNDLAMKLPRTPQYRQYIHELHHAEINNITSHNQLRAEAIFLLTDVQRNEYYYNEGPIVPFSMFDNKRRKGELAGYAWNIIDDKLVDIKLNQKPQVIGLAAGMNMYVIDGVRFDIDYLRKKAIGRLSSKQYDRYIKQKTVTQIPLSNTRGLDMPLVDCIVYLKPTNDQPGASYYSDNGTLHDAINHFCERGFDFAVDQLWVKYAHRDDPAKRVHIINQLVLK